MITKHFGLRTCGLILASQYHSLMNVMVVGTCLLLASGCALLRPTRPILHKPNGDLNPVLTLNVPKHIGTLAAIPRNKIIVANGINVGDGSRNIEQLVEFFLLSKAGIEYEFELFTTEGDAIRRFEFEKQDRDHPIYRETAVEGCSGALHYTWEPRADPEGGSGGMGYYHSRASLRLRNVFIRVTTRDEKRESDNLTKAVKELAEMIRGAQNKSN